jgi:hypothetical protein
MKIFYRVSRECKASSRQVLRGLIKLSEASLEDILGLEEMQKESRE